MDEKTAIVDFRPPPPAKSPLVGKVDWPAVVSLLVSRPGEAGWIGTFSSGVASHIRSGRYRHFLDDAHVDASDEEKRAYIKDHWLVQTRTAGKTEEGQPVFDIYVTWLG